MKLPKCPHCDKLLSMMVGDAFVVGAGETRHELAVTYLCPETLAHRQPEWVEVLEIT